MFSRRSQRRDICFIHIWFPYLSVICHKKEVFFSQKLHTAEVKFTLANDTFLRVEGNTSSRGWGTQGANGGDVILAAEDQEINGNILVDSISSLDMTLKGSAFTGAVNPDGEGGTVRVTMDSASTWTLTSDSYVTEFNGDVSQITANGYHLYVNGEAVV